MDYVLIGMPGCGKTTIGRLVAERLGREFCDVDAGIEKREERSINEIFEKDGEEYFRKVETETFRNLMGNDSVIATGGGIVTRDENLDIAKCGLVIFIDRDIEDIIGDVDTDTRPLLKNGAERLYKLYEQRYDRYCDFSDMIVKNSGSIEEIVDKIIDCIERKCN